MSTELDKSAGGSPGPATGPELQNILWLFIRKYVDYNRNDILHFDNLSRRDFVTEGGDASFELSEAKHYRLLSGWLRDRDRSRQETEVPFSRVRAEIASRQSKDEQIKSLQERCDALSTQIEFLKTRNSELRESVVEQRKAVARETQKYDQLQKQLERLIDGVNERGRANDRILSCFMSRPDSHIRLSECYEGVVEDAAGDTVTVVYEVNGDIVEQTYESSQFCDHRLPDVGARLAVYVVVAEVQPKPIQDIAEEPVNRDDSPRTFRKPLNGPTEF